MIFLTVLMLSRQERLKNYPLSQLAFLDKWFRFQSSVRFNNVLMMSFGVNNTANLKIHGVDYCCIIFGISINKGICIYMYICRVNKKWIIEKYKKSWFFLSWYKDEKQKILWQQWDLDPQPLSS